MSNAPQELDPFEKAAGLLTGGFAAVTTVLGALSAGSSNSLVERMVRNYTFWSQVAFLTIELSIGSAVLALILSGGRRSRWLLGSSSLMFIFGLGLLTVPAIRVQSSGERPSVSVTLKTDPIPTIAATIRATGVRATDDVNVHIDALKLCVWQNNDPKRTCDASLHQDQQDTTWQYQKIGQTLYSASLGPSPTGEVQFSLDFPLPTRTSPDEDYTFVGVKAVVAGAASGCTGRGEGCTIIRRPEQSMQPQLSTSWETANSTVSPTDQLLVVSLAGQDLMPEEGVLLRVVEEDSSAGSTPTDVYSTILAANAIGTLDSVSIKIPINKDLSHVCVMAIIARAADRLTDPAAGCPPDQFKGVWAKLQVP